MKNTSMKLRNYYNSIKDSPSPKLRLRQGDQTLYNPNVIATVDDYYPDGDRGSAEARDARRASQQKERRAYYLEKSQQRSECRQRKMSIDE